MFQPQLAGHSYNRIHSVNTIWQKIGQEVEDNLSPLEMCEAAGANWAVGKYPTFYNRNDKVMATKDQALVREDTGGLLDTISGDWKPVQNEDAFQFFDEFVKVGDMKMDSAGVLNGGRMVWCSARVDQPIEVTDGDIIQPYMMFGNPHKYGSAIDVRLCLTRLVSGAAHGMLLSEGGKAFVKTNHRSVFDPVKVKRAMAMVADRVVTYRENAVYLAGKRAKREDVIEFLKKVFPAGGDKGLMGEMSLSAKKCFDLLETQPGAELAPGTWWNVYTGVTYMVNHVKGRSDGNRMDSALYGAGANEMDRALKLALSL